MSDIDSDVRSVAVNVLASNCSQGDKMLIKLFTNIVRDKTNPHSVRYAAYLGLYAVTGREDEISHCLPIKFPEEIDWGFVSSLE